jgi:hypothetical protein
MTIKDYKPKAVEGDRFEPDEDDVSQQPDLEDDPDHPEDILPDQVRRFSGSGQESEEGEEEEEDDRRITARPREPMRPIVTSELPDH